MDRPVRKFQYEVTPPGGARTVTRSMREAARLGVDAAGGDCQVVLMGDRGRVVGRHAFKCQSVVASNEEGLKYGRWLLKHEDRDGGWNFANI